MSRSHDVIESEHSTTPASATTSSDSTSAATAGQSAQTGEIPTAASSASGRHTTDCTRSTHDHNGRKMPFSIRQRPGQIEREEGTGSMSEADRVTDRETMKELRPPPAPMPGTSIFHTEADGSKSQVMHITPGSSTAMLGNQAAQATPLTQAFTTPAGPSDWAPTVPVTTRSHASSTESGIDPANPSASHPATPDASTSPQHAGHHASHLPQLDAPFGGPYYRPERGRRPGDEDDFFNEG